jgi:tetratricopeptide (TPR) repeat protein
VAKLLKVRWAFVICAALLVGTTLVPSAQGQRGSAAPATPADPALQALNRGDYDAVEKILGAATDPRSIALRGRALIERGRYPEAEKLLTSTAAAQPGSDAALELGLLHLQLGKRDSGRRLLSGVLRTAAPRTAADYLRLGLAARALGTSTAESQLLHEANGFFRNANRLEPGNARVNAAWGEIFFETYEPAEASRSFKEALEADPTNVQANVGMARVMYQENPPASKAALEAALKINPSSVPANLFAAEMALDERRRDDARASVETALKVNPNSLEARALRGAIAFLEGRNDDLEREAQEALTINPLSGEVYRVAGDHAARNYRFDEAVDLAQRALKLDPDSTRAHGDLGMSLMRTGDESTARTALERSFAADPFHQPTHNLLMLLDSLETFETITEGDIVMRLHPDEATVMREHAMPLAREALDALQQRYQFKVRGPILIEMFPKHEDFAVRTQGIPGLIGALGVCFGRVVTLDSPRARKPGEFNWGETLWHELAHVITLQMSNNRLPRWVSEGTSVFEERRARPEWGRESQLTFAQALEEGKAIKLDVINEAFTDSRLITLAYYQSSLIIEMLVDMYGEPKFHEFIRAYGRGLEDAEALKEAFGVTIPELQQAFDARIEKQFAATRAALKRPEIKEKPSLDELKALAEANPGSFAVLMQLGVALKEAGDHAAAIQQMERASALIPEANGDNNPNRLIAAIAIEQKDTARAIQALEAVVRVDPSDVESARTLASLVAPLGDARRTEQAYQRVIDIDPFDTKAQAEVGRLAMARNDATTAMRSFASSLAMKPADRATALADLAEAQLAAGRPADAKRQALAALEIAPSFERAQDLLLRIVEAEKGK